MAHLWMTFRALLAPAALLLACSSGGSASTETGSSGAGGSKTAATGSGTGGSAASTSSGGGGSTSTGSTSSASSTSTGSASSTSTSSSSSSSSSSGGVDACGICDRVWVCNGFADPWVSAGPDECADSGNSTTLYCVNGDTINYPSADPSENDGTWAVTSTGLALYFNSLQGTVEIDCVPGP